AGFERPGDDDRIAVHAEDDDARMRIVRPHSADQRQAAEPAVSHRQIDDGDVGPMAAVELVAGGRVRGLEYALDPGVLQHPPAALSHDRMIVDDENAGHHPARPGACERSPAFEPSGSGSVTRTQVPLPGSLSIV